MESCERGERNKRGNAMMMMMRMRVRWTSNRAAYGYRAGGCCYVLLVTVDSKETVVVHKGVQGDIVGEKAETREGP